MVTGLASLVTLLLAILLWRAPWLVVKPTIQFVIATNVLIQWPMAYFQDTIFEGVSSPAFVAMSIALPLVCALAWVPFVGGPACLRIWQRAQEFSDDSSLSSPSVKILIPLWFVVGLVAAWYLGTVSLAKTGLYVLLTHPATAALAREDSLKLLPNRALVYAYLSVGLVFCPIICSLSFRLGLAAWRAKRRLLAVFWVASLGASLAIASLSGARSFPAKAILVVLLARWFETGMRIRLVRLIALPVVVLLPVALLTMLREGRGIDALRVGHYLATAVMDRALFVPSQVGIFHLRYAQERGEFGVAAVPRLAAIAGVESVIPSNVVGRHYVADAGPTVSANASFLFTYISYFGVAGVLINVVLVGALEWTLLVLDRTGPTLLGPTLALFAVAGISYLSADYTTVLLSSGVLLAGGLALAGSLWVDVHSRGHLQKGTIQPAI